MRLGSRRQIRSKSIESSTLSRLFNFAKATDVDPKENFTTEALAAAIRADERPLRDVLKTHGIVLSDAKLRVDTQVWIAGVGQLDLVVRGTDPQGVEQLLAFEIKVDAEESGEQLKNYTAWRDGAPSSRRVIVLAPRELRTSQGLPWIRWQELWIRSGEKSHTYWTDLSRWLEELGMADESYESIGPGDAVSIRGARLLMKKVSRILEPVSVKLNEAWGGSDWPTEGDVLAQLEQRFYLPGPSPTFSIEHRTPYKDAGVSVGLFDDTKGLRLGVWIWADPRKVGEDRGLRDAVARLVETKSADWSHPDDVWLLARVSKPVAEFKDQAEASLWLKERVKELDAVTAALTARARP